MRTISLVLLVAALSTLGLIVGAWTFDAGGLDEAYGRALLGAAIGYGVGLILAAVVVRRSDASSRRPARRALLALTLLLAVAVLWWSGSVTASRILRDEPRAQPAAGAPSRN